MKSDTFTPLINLYAAMDADWQTRADQYDFQCNGCVDNCCKSLFYHHTHVEKEYLLFGFKRLPRNQQTAIKDLAKEYCDTTFKDTADIKSAKRLCPANEKGRCLLYQYRPMICRLHGIPHELNRPGYEPFRGPGCDAGGFDQKAYITFDRTPYYREMTRIEMDFRQNQDRTDKIKLTIAQILLSE